ncbi:MAG: EamA family transporter RarD [Spirochaetales bacterium]|nr:EamA family transporter RarD [Spirochaetales bacterium]
MGTVVKDGSGQRDAGSDARAMTLGTAYGLAAYLMWGLFPLYWKALSYVPATQILAHRIVWAFAFTVLIAVGSRKSGAFRDLLADRKRLLSTIAAGALVSANWGIYIWAVNDGRIVETSLGYYLNPLVSVILGGVALRERIDRGIKLATAAAAVGVIVLALSYGRIPWVSLVLALTFATYSLVKKLAGLDAVVGMVAETAAVFPLAFGFLLFRHGAGDGAFWNSGVKDTVLLALAGPVTAIPLLAFAAGLKRIPLSRMGFLQYVSPSLQLFLGVVVYGEAFSGTHAIGFGTVIAALAIYLSTRKTARRIEQGGTEARR